MTFTKLEKRLGIIVLVYIAIILFGFSRTHAQVIVSRKDNVEIIKGKKAGEYQAKVYSSPQWTETGKSLLTYDAMTGVVTSRNRTVQYIPIAGTAKLEKKVEKGNASVKEFYNVPDSKTTRLSWKVKTTANETKFDDKTGRLTYFDTQGILLFFTPPPVSWDSDKKPVKIEVSFVDNQLIYDIIGDNYAYPITVDPTTVVTTNDCSIYSTDATYLTARNAVTGDAVGSVYLYVGQDSTGYYVYRPFLSFVIPDMATISAGSLFLEGNLDNSETDFNIQGFTATYSNPGVKEDFDLFDGWQASGAYNGTVLNDTWNTKGYSDTWNEIVLNAAGLAAILAKKNDTFLIALLSEQDKAADDPTEHEYIIFESSTTSGKEPYLYITYTVPSTGTRTIVYDKEPRYIWNNGSSVPIWKP